MRWRGELRWCSLARWVTWFTHRAIFYAAGGGKGLAVTTSKRSTISNPDVSNPRRLENPGMCFICIYGDHVPTDMMSNFNIAARESHNWTSYHEKYLVTTRIRYWYTSSQFIDMEMIDRVRDTLAFRDMVEVLWKTWRSVEILELDENLIW